ncbi:unnamed protein product [Ostreobium quekettii]|uniref:Endonuclease/exonuclease/phosphatase domain-containing protein n=1 Tax=Ostreobium quekettii TaxID=121088 RepID=A0A8S1JFT3_9CHLO|nr:unnamed protein product [Ostreobium quekettii]
MASAVEGDRGLEYIPGCRRPWSQENVATTPNGCQLRVMTYNILAEHLAHKHVEDLYPNCPREFLSWRYRWRLIRNEIQYHRPDVVCLQEVDRFDQIQAELDPMGYLGLFVKRSGSYLDGCATFWCVRAISN